MNKKNNVLIFCVDQMRADHLGCSGNKVVRTPNLDKLASEGTLFTRSYCNNPTCMPARASMFTGLLPRDHGVRVNGQNLRRDIPTLADELLKNGYRTHAAGKLHLTAWMPGADQIETDKYPEALQYWNDGIIDKVPDDYYGFETVDYVGGHTEYAFGNYIDWLKDKGGSREDLSSKKALAEKSGAPQCYKMSMPEALHYNRFISDSTIGFIRNAAKNGEHFLAWCSYPDPHHPIAPPMPYCDMYSPDEIQLPARRSGEFEALPPFYAKILTGELRPNGIDNRNITDRYLQEMIALTYGMITHIDTEAGRVLNALEALDLQDDTLVVFLSDHGDMMGDHGLIWKGIYTFKGCINIPTIIKAPGCRKGVVSDALISQVDLMPSVLELCGIPMPGSDWIKIKTPFERGSMLPLHTYPGRSYADILNGSISRIRENVVIENDDPSTGFQARCLVTDEYRITVYPGTVQGELFDLKNDPDELYNRWHDVEYADLKCRLIAELLNSYSLHTPYYPVPYWNS